MHSVHLCVTLVHTKPGIKEKFVNDVRDVLADIRRTPNEQCSKKVGHSRLFLISRF